jgi:signal peptidase II
MKTKVKYALILLIFMVGCNSDQFTKHLARESLKHNPPIVILKNFIDLCYAENTGTAFSRLDNLTLPLSLFVLVCVPLLAVLCIAYLIWRFRSKSFNILLPFVLILAGATGNLLDRIRYGHVVDFIHLHLRDVFHWPIFNIADFLLFIGCGMLLFRFIFHRDDQSFQISENN